VLARIVAALAPAPGDTIVEIGPGEGVLTRALLARLPHLTAIEIDRDLAARLAAEFPPERLTLHCADALDFDFGALGPGFRLVGNLPYNISTPLLFQVARHVDRLRDAHFMLQREVVDRMVAQPSTPEYGRLSVMLQYYFDAEKILDVTAAAFRPRPRVESAVVRMSPRPPSDQRRCDEALLGEVAKAAFSQRRKTLRNALKAHLQADDFADLGIAPVARAQDLRVADFVRIANHLVARRAAHAQKPRPR
jgi:16S rRNA (adenine1518-N6/adenine1519-N6)-dimethyltransferase